MALKFKVKSIEKKNIYTPEEHGISQSLLSEFRTCETGMRFILEGYYKPQISEPLIFGTCFHEALDHIYNMILKQTIVDQDSLIRYIGLNSGAMFNPVRKEYENKGSDAMQIVENKARIVTYMLPLYFRFWKNDFKIKWEGLETQFKMPIANMHIRGKRDGEFIDKENKLWLFETKTKARYDSETIMKLLLTNTQVMIYLLSLFYDKKIRPAGVLYNIIRNPGIKKTVKDTWDMYRRRLESDIKSRPAFYFQRIPKYMLFSRVEAYRKKLIKELSNFKTWCYSDPSLDILNGDACERKYGKCQFIDVCTSKGKDTSFLDVRTDLFPELKEKRS